MRIKHHHWAKTKYFWCPSEQKEFGKVFCHFCLSRYFCGSDWAKMTKLDSRPNKPGFQEVARIRREGEEGYSLQMITRLKFTPIISLGTLFSRLMHPISLCEKVRSEQKNHFFQTWNVGICVCHKIALCVQPWHRLDLSFPTKR